MQTEFHRKLRTPISKSLQIKLEEQKSSDTSIIQASEIRMSFWNPAISADFACSYCNLKQPRYSLSNGLSVLPRNAKILPQTICTRICQSTHTKDETMVETGAVTPIMLRPSPTAMAIYRATARRRAAEASRALALRRARALEVARKAAALLKEEFSATQVTVFGSTVHGLWFSTTSDIDLAASGLASDDYFTAVARLQNLSPEFKVDLVMLEHCKAELCESIARVGVIL